MNHTGSRFDMICTCNGCYRGEWGVRWCIIYYTNKVIKDKNLSEFTKSIIKPF